MEDVLDLLCRDSRSRAPVVFFDESPTQLIGEVRQPIPAQPGQLERYDCEYRSNGTTNLFVFLDTHQPLRTVKITDSRTACDFAECMRDLVDLHYPKAERIRVALDNLSTIQPVLSMRPSRLPKRIGSCAAWSSTTLQNTPLGSTWLRSKSAACEASASTAE